jgi:hypothetical protein
VTARVVFMATAAAVLTLLLFVAILLGERWLRSR